MAKREALRELQSRLAERLQAVRDDTRTANWLAVECAGQGLLLPLHQAGEIFSLTALVQVPHTQSWFMGVANLRGRLHGVVDIAAFLGLRTGAPEIGREQSRLIAFNPNLEVNCALLIDRLTGLRSSEQLTPNAGHGERPAFAGASFTDAGGRHWQEIQLASLATDPLFLRVGR